MNMKQLIWNYWISACDLIINQWIYILLLLFREKRGKHIFLIVSSCWTVWVSLIVFLLDFLHLNLSWNGFIWDQWCCLHCNSCVWKSESCSMSEIIVVYFYMYLLWLSQTLFIRSFLFADIWLNKATAGSWCILC